MSTIVVALGGNALQVKGEASAQAQQRVANQSAKNLLPLIEAGHRLIIVHGNGPQVGNIILHEEAINTDEVPTLPLDSCGAMSQGLIGYWLQQSLQNQLAARNMSSPVVSLITQTVVDSHDKAFQDPTKPIGPFYDLESEARQAAAERNFVVKEDAGRGWRRVVASPKPLDFVELPAIRSLIQANAIVVTAGGGGVPVVKTEEGYVGIEAVIDKDLSAALLASDIDAESLIILTSIDNAMINYGTPEQRPLGKVSVDEMKTYVEQGHFAAGSMLPKIEAAIGFVHAKQGRKAIITSLENVSDALTGESGTVIQS